MANWITRNPDAYGNHQFRYCDDPPLDEQANWLRLGADRPETLTGEADPTKWTVIGDTVTLKPAADLRILAAVRKIGEINGYAAFLISQGFVYGGLTFSLSDAAQRNLLDLRQSAASLTWPQEIESQDDGAVLSLASPQEGLAFYNAAWDAIRAVRAAARARKSLVRAALINPDAAAGLAAIQAISVPW